MSYLEDPRAFWAAERTLLAWIRTQIALIALAILIAKAPAMAGEAPVDDWTITLMTSLICGFATLSAVLSAMQFHGAIKKMGPQELPSNFAPTGLKITAIVNLAIILTTSIGVVLATL